jgi:hypothetical protein
MGCLHCILAALFGRRLCPKTQQSHRLAGRRQSPFERLIELPVNSARREIRPSLELVVNLRELLCNCGPDVRHRAAQLGFLLVDLSFTDSERWQPVRLGSRKHWRRAEVPERFLAHPQYLSLARH